MVSAWVSLLKVDSDASAEQYKFRFNKKSSSLFSGYSFITIKKTPSHIIITPLTQEDGVNIPYAMSFCFDKNGGAIISANRLVRQEGFFRRSMFDGGRYRVKRDKHGNVIICLKERIDATQ